MALILLSISELCFKEVSASIAGGQLKVRGAGRYVPSPFSLTDDSNFMVPNKFFDLQAQQMQKQAENLHSKLIKEALQHFLDRTTHDINDALVSILGVCDAEAPALIAKVKKYIHRINNSLRFMKGYQASAHGKDVFLIAPMLQNAMDVIEDHFRGKIKFSRLISEMKAKAKGDQSKLESFLLGIFIRMAEGASDGNSEVLVELRQKDQSAMITILKDHFIFSEDALKEIKERSGHFLGECNVTRQGQGVEIIIRIPLIFEQYQMQPFGAFEIPTVEITSIKLKTKEKTGARERI